MAEQESAVLLVDWENLSGAILGRGKRVSRTQVDDLWQFASRKSGSGCAKPTWPPRASIPVSRPP